MFQNERFLCEQCYKTVAQSMAPKNVPGVATGAGTVSSQHTLDTGKPGKYMYVHVFLIVCTAWNVMNLSASPSVACPVP